MPKPAHYLKSTAATSKYILAEKIAVELRISQRAAYDLIHTGEIAGGFRFGRSLRVLRTEFVKYVEKCRIKKRGRPLVEDGPLPGE